MTNLIRIGLILIILIVSVFAWDNGLLRTPPMGWISWLRFTCQLDCDQYPNECINEKLYKDMVDRMAQDGYLEAGYNTVNIDDCWMEKERDPETKRLVADRQRFPNGIKHLVEYGRAKNVSIGIYQDIGTKTCAGFPGTYSGNEDHSEIDSKTFAEWGVDSIKMDGCFAKLNEFNKKFTKYRKALEKQDHKIAFCCEWPSYLSSRIIEDVEFESIKQNCNYWRNYEDVVDSYESLQRIIFFYATHNNLYIKFNGGWFDPDMLTIGNNGLSLEQSKTQMNFWSMWSSPLFMSADLRTIRPEFKAILLNKNLIAINQDPLGIMATKIIHNEKIQVWSKRLSPICENGPSPFVVLYYYSETLGNDLFMSYELSKLIPEEFRKDKYEIKDLYTDKQDRSIIITSNQSLRLLVPSSGGSRIVKLVPITNECQ
ncbi:Alpha-N-acetylgalactosaminidase [Sarcoptes scabiei]|nr:Alpha-N-acetylgalactosaminidase [Sarcoptes scabiei]